MHEPRFVIRRARWDQDAPALRQLRARVFIEEQGVPPALEWDRADPLAIHLLALGPGGVPIGTARLLPSGQIGRMAVSQPWRGRGIGQCLLQELLGIARTEGYPTPFLNAQTRVMDFYRRQGFRPVGPEFLEAGIPHHRMVLATARESEPPPLP
jgi:predicted GNAT family N-acyltransferase